MNYLYWKYPNHTHPVACGTGKHWDFLSVVKCLWNVWCKLLDTSLLFLVLIQMVCVEGYFGLGRVWLYISRVYFLWCHTSCNWTSMHGWQAMHKICIVMSDKILIWCVYVTVSFLPIPVSTCLIIMFGWLIFVTCDVYIVLNCSYTLSFSRLGRTGKFWVAAGIKPGLISHLKATSLAEMNHMLLFIENFHVLNFLQAGWTRAVNPANWIMHHQQVEQLEWPTQ